MNSNLLVGKFYTMDSETEDLVYADQIKNGMVVLIESAIFREDPNAPNLVGNDAWNDRLMKENRWCEVSNLRVIPTSREAQIRFIGIYADGVKKVRTYNEHVGFYVKKDSLNLPENKPAAMEHENADEPEGSSDLVTMTQVGTGVQATVSKEELAGIKNPQFFVQTHTPKGRSMDIQSPEGPLARALGTQANFVHRGPR